MPAELPGKFVSSHRYTTSSRTPGRINHGVVQLLPSGLRRCPDCGGLCNDEIRDGRHAPHWATCAGGLELVNCVGRRCP